MNEAVTMALVAGGSAVGGVSRYLMASRLDARLAECWPGFPWGTLLVNVLGCLVIGVAAAFADRPWVRFGVMVGILGGFTTFSAFGLQTWTLLMDGRLVQGCAYAGASLLVCLLAVALGALGGRLITG